PSGRPGRVRGRTTTQRTTSPALTSPPELAFLTLAMIVSPRPAVRRLYREALPPRTLMHITSLAPVLSATSSRVCIWIMGQAPLLQCGHWLLARPEFDSHRSSNRSIDRGGRGSVRVRPGRHAAASTAVTIQRSGRGPGGFVFSGQGLL